MTVPASLSEVGDYSRDAAEAAPPYYQLPFPALDRCGIRETFLPFRGSLGWTMPKALRQPAQESTGLRTVGWLLLALVLQIGASRWHDPTVISVDYLTLWAVPQTLASAPDRNFYSPDNQRLMATAARSGAASGSRAHQLAMTVSDGFYQGRIDATGSPLAYALVGLTSTGDYDDDLDRFTIASLIAFVVSMWMLCRLLQFSPTATVVAAVAYSLCFSPLLADLRAVNLNQVQLLFLSLFLWLNHQKKIAAAGVVLGIGIALKPNIAAVLMIVGLVAVIDARLRDRRRLFVGAAFGLAIGVIVASTYFGTFKVWEWFLSSVTRTLEVGYPLAQGNYALASLIAALMGAEVSLLLTMALTAVLLVLIGTRRVGVGPSTLDEDFLIVGLGCVVMLLGSRLVWIHYYVLLIPLSLYLLRPSGETADHRFGPIAAGVGLLLLSPAAQAKTGLFGAAMANIATMLVFGAGLAAWWTVRLNKTVKA